MLSKIQPVVWAVVAVTGARALRLDSTPDHPMQAKAGRRKKFMCLQNWRGNHNKSDRTDADTDVESSNNNKSDKHDALCTPHGGGHATPNLSEAQENWKPLGWGWFRKTVEIHVYFPNCNDIFNDAEARYPRTVESYDLTLSKDDAPIKRTVKDFLTNPDGAHFFRMRKEDWKKPYVYAAFFYEGEGPTWVDLSDGNSELGWKHRDLSELVQDMPRSHTGTGNEPLEIFVSPEKQYTKEAANDLRREYAAHINKSKAGGGALPTAPTKVEDAPPTLSKWFGSSFGSLPSRLVV